MTYLSIINLKHVTRCVTHSVTQLRISDTSYLFIIVLEILNISNKNIQGIMVDGEEIKLQIFADDLTAFLQNSGTAAYIEEYGVK